MTTPTDNRGPWWRRKWVIVGGILLALIIVGAALDSSEESAVDLEVETPIASPEPTEVAVDAPTSAASVADVYQPDNEGSDDEPFWSTTFELVLPDGAWSSGRDDLYACQPIDEDRYVLKTSDGRLVDESLVFGRTDSAFSGGDCIVRVVAIGNFDVLDNEYVISNGERTAMIRAEEMFAGQDAGTDGRTTLRS